MIRRASDSSSQPMIKTSAHRIIKHRPLMRGLTSLTNQSSQPKCQNPLYIFSLYNPKTTLNLQITRAAAQFNSSFYFGFAQQKLLTRKGDRLFRWISKQEVPPSCNEIALLQFGYHFIMIQPNTRTTNQAQDKPKRAFFHRLEKYRLVEWATHVQFNQTCRIRSPTSNSARYK